LIDEDIVALQNCTNLEKVVLGPCGGAYQTCHDASQAMKMKAEKMSDAEEEEVPVPIAFPKIKAEPEVSSMSLYVDC
jgi:hypothetical protein